MHYHSAKALACSSLAYMNPNRHIFLSPSPFLPISHICAVSPKPEDTVTLNAYAPVTSRLSPTVQVVVGLRALEG